MDITTKSLTVTTIIQDYGFPIVAVFLFYMVSVAVHHKRNYSKAGLNQHNLNCID